MSALTQVISAQRPEIKVKALMLPPIEGVGMAANSELKELMKLRGWEGAYLQSMSWLPYLPGSSSWGRRRRPG